MTYRPTAEQAQTSALCRALGSMGATERDVIEHLFQAYGALEEYVKKEAEMRIMPLRIDATDVRQAIVEERDACVGAIEALIEGLDPWSHDQGCFTKPAYERAIAAIRARTSQ